MVRSTSLSRRQQSEFSLAGSPVKILLSDENRSRLWWWGGGIGSVFLCLILGFLYHRHNESVRLQSLHDGISALQNGKGEDAISYLEDANAKMISSNTDDQGQLIRLYLAQAYLQSGKLDDAKKLLELQTYQDRDSTYLSQLRLLLAGRLAEKQNDLQSARKAYEEAAILEGPFAAEVLLSLARVADASGDTASALSAREKFLSDFPNSPFANLVQQKVGK